ncbi:hypothetical protein NQ317_004592 [Molorchus minor]|uniref:PH domain-containing protein n=1 Tax=Molorchus minor TaxID=1323400 RepID=A0ABQ9JAQ6_9CUCU|nr:hypothetical protein NQ317_004592 [Molorchus minor]
MENGEIKLKKTHNYYYQVQGQLAITKANKCYFIIYSGDQNNLFVEEIPRNDLFWQNILAKLTQFYVNCIAPQIILNRRGKKRKCKDPNSIEAQKKKLKIDPIKIFFKMVLFFSRVYLNFRYNLPGIGPR